MKLRYLGAAGLAANALPALAPVAPAVARWLGVETRLETSKGVALSFDDGPHPDGTAEVLRLLEREGARATFFLVGEQVERRPALAAEISAAGHEVGLHCHRHRNMLRLTPGQVREDLRRGAAAIAEATGIAPQLHRPPYGIYSAIALSAVRRFGYRPFLWSRWGRDWSRRATPDSIAALVAGEAGAGDVLLLHDADYYSVPQSWRQTVAALPAVLERLRGQGLAIVSIGD